MKALFGKPRIAFKFVFLIATATFLVAQKPLETKDQGTVKYPDGAGGFIERARPSGETVVTGNGINYHGGPVLLGNPVPVYIIWYGNWTNGPLPSDSATTVNLIDTLLGANALGNSGYEKINSTYGDNTGNVTGNLQLVKQIFDTGSEGTRLKNRKISAAISAHLAAGDLPTDPNGVYLFMTSSNIKESGFCSSFCGFHTAQTLNGADIKWAFIGNVDRCPRGCEAQTTTPNNDSGADGMADVIGHETEEAISDPDLNAWFDQTGQENADKCNFRFGPTQTAPNGSQFNQTLGGLNWLIQMNWENSRGGGCDQTLGGPFF